MGISGPAAFIAAQIQRDMPRDGTGSVSAASLVSAAGMRSEGLKDCLADAIAELTLRLPESHFSAEVHGDCVVFKRKPAFRGLIVFAPADGSAEPAAAKMSREVDPETVSRLMTSAVSLGDQNDAAGRRILLTALGKRPADEVEAVLGSALWTKKKQTIRFWAAATIRLKDAANDETWARRLQEAQDLMVEQQSGINMLAVVLARAKEPQLVADSLAAGLLPSRVRAEIEKRKLEKAAQKRDED